MEERHSLSMVELEALFKEYHSIDNGKQGVVSKFSAEVQQQETFVVLEKVHGSNFSFWCDGTELHCARRTSMLAPNETFYDFQKARDKYTEAVFTLFKKTLEGHTDIVRVAVYGELFGGIYPHAEVEDVGAQPVQRGVYYAPWIDFYAFDVKLFPKEGEPYWMDYLEASNLFQACGFFYAKPLFEGTINDCFKFDTKINSSIPALLGLPPLPPKNNIIEGVVIKARDPKVGVPNKFKTLKRAIFKVKNAKFAEINPPAPLTKHEQQREKTKEAVERAFTEVERYINENRLDNLQSKMGPLTEQNSTEAAELLCVDVMKDFIKDNAELWSLVEESKQEGVQKAAAYKVKAFIREWINNKKQDQG